MVVSCRICWPCWTVPTLKAPKYAYITFINSKKLIKQLGVELTKVIVGKIP